MGLTMSEPSESGVDAKDDTPLTASAMVPPEGINLQPDVAAAIAKAFPVHPNAAPRLVAGLFLLVVL